MIGLGSRFGLAALGILGTLSSPAYGWPITLGAAGDESGISAAVLHPSGDVVAGGYVENGSTGVDQAIRAFDPATGAERWRWTLAEVGSLSGVEALGYLETIQQVALAPDGDVVGVGRSDLGTASALVHGLVVRVDGTTGAERWLRKIDGDYAWPAAYNGFATAGVDANGDVIVGGGLQNAPALLNDDFAVLKLAGGDGTTLWRTSIAGEVDADGLEFARQVLIDAHGDVLALGTLVRPYQFIDLIAVKLDGATGAELWRWSTSLEQQYSADCGTGEMTIDAAGDVFVLRPLADCKGVVTKLAGATGMPVWDQPVLEHGNVTHAVDLAVDAAGDVTVVGDVDGAAAALQLAGADGALVWQRTLHPYLFDRAVNLWGVMLRGSSDAILVGTVTGRAVFWDLSRTDGSTRWATVFPSSPTTFVTNPYRMTIDAAGDAWAFGLRNAAGGYGPGPVNLVWKVTGADGALPLCGNGTLDPGEQCDDGNTTDGDGCDHDCAPSVCVGGVAIQRAKVSFTHLDGIARAAAIISGDLAFPDGTPADYDPATTGLQLLVGDTGVLPPIELTHRWTPISGDPAGVCDAARDRWTATSSSVSLRNGSGMVDAPICTPHTNLRAGGGPLLSFRLTDRRAARGVISFKAKLRAASIPEPTAPVRLVVVLGSGVPASLAGACASHTFAAAECVASMGKSYRCAAP